MLSANNKHTEREKRSKFVTTLLTSSFVASIVATILTSGINFWIGRTEKRVERKRMVAEELLNYVLPLQNKFEALLMQPDFGATDSEIKSQAKFVLLLSNEVKDKCSNRPFVEEPCRLYMDWHKLAVPLLEQCAKNDRAQAQIIKKIQAAKSKKLSDEIENFRVALKKIIEESY